MPLEKDLQEGDRWVFDEGVANDFEDMLRRSIPDYDTMRALVTSVAAEFLPGYGGYVLDVGTSRGDTIQKIIDHVGPDKGHTYIGVEISEPMAKIAQDRFASQPYANFKGGISIYHADIYEGIPDPHGFKFDVVTVVLTLMFIPVEHRAEILRTLRNAMKPGSVLILVEKTLMGFGDVQVALTNVYRDLKRQNGYSDEEITRKAAALVGVQIPFTENGYVEMLEQTGFRVEPFWRWGPFAGWVAVAV